MNYFGSVGISSYKYLIFYRPDFCSPLIKRISNREIYGSPICIPLFDQSANYFLIMCLAFREQSDMVAENP